LKKAFSRMKRFFDGEWEYGRSDHFYWFDGDLYFYNVTSHLDWDREKCKVDYHTEGVNTNLLDKNRKEIFVGDILRGSYDGVPYQGKVIYRNDVLAFKHDSDKYKYCAALDDHLNMEIIGNIYDNPDLLSNPE
jgi:uncharacterized phage protein (TIGR01671 family)